MAKEKSKGPGRRAGTGAALGAIFNGRRLLRVLRVVLPAVLLAALIWWRHPILSVILNNVGFGFLLPALWLAPFAWALRRAWRRKLRLRWHRWLGALILAFAGWGFLVFFHPEGLRIEGVEFGERTLGGLFGISMMGGPGLAWGSALRFVGLVVAGMASIAPGPTWRLLRALVLAAGRLLGLIQCWVWGVAVGAGRWCWSQGPHRWLWEGLRWLFRRRPVPAPQRLRLPTSRSAPSPALERKKAPPKPLTRQLPPPAEAGPEAEVEKVEPRLPSRPEAEVAPPPPKEPWPRPALELLDLATERGVSPADNQERARLIEEALASYGVEAKVVQVNPGPAVTQFAVEPGWDYRYRRASERDEEGNIKLDRNGKPRVRVEESRTRVKVERITSLANDLALALSAPSIRIEAPVPGKPVVGIEVPNTTTVIVPLREVMESPAFQRMRARTRLPLALGKGAGGEVVVADLGKMPHLLIAGATGSGKTVCLHGIITCLLMTNTPEEVRLLLIDPKRVELTAFSGVPHLIQPVVVDMEHAVESLRRALREMDLRYRQFAEVGARNIEGYNRTPPAGRRMSYLAVIIDELADMMMTAPDVVEPLICRLAQLARATGIHLVIATQRPSVDVITGLIKANFPTRIAFAVASQVDSRTILDMAGAEKLLGRGDMLYMAPEAAKPKRLRGSFASDQEIGRVVDHWREQVAFGPLDEVAVSFATQETKKSADPVLEKARELARGHTRISTSLLQRRLRIGYPRAARLIDQLEEEGLVDRGETAKPSEVHADIEDERHEESG